MTFQIILVLECPFHIYLFSDLSDIDNILIGKKYYMLLCLYVYMFVLFIKLNIFQYVW